MECRKKWLGSTSCLSSLAVLICVFLISSSILITEGKRFDCRMFCKETGFHGMVGGCRCSFTLFTAKRAIRDPLDDFAKLSYGGSFQRLENLNSKESSSVDASSGESPSEEKEEQGRELPPRFRYMKYVNLGHDSEEKPNQQTSSGPYPESPLEYANLMKKRRELEQDLDNGETADFFRLPY